MGFYSHYLIMLVYECFNVVWLSDMLLVLCAGITIHEISIYFDQLFGHWLT